MRKITLMLIAWIAFISSMQAQFTESFDTEIPSDWTVINNDGQDNTWEYYDESSNSYEAYQGTGTARITYESAPHDDYLISPQFTVTDGVSDLVVFYASGTGNVFPESFDVKISTAGVNVSDFTETLGSEVTSDDAGNGEYSEYSYDLSDYEGDDVYLAIVATSTNEFYLFIDEFSITTPPSCLSPENLVAENVTSDGVDLSWDEESNASEGYHWYVFEAGDNPEDDDPVADDTSTDEEVTVTGLDSSTNYDAYVVADCDDDGESELSDPISFTTACDEFGDFTEDFETTPTSADMPTCWSRNIVSATTSPYVYTSTSNVNSGSRALRLGNSSDSAAELYAISPQLTALPNQTHRIRFYATKSGESTELMVGTMTDPTDETTFTEVETVSVTTGVHAEYSVNFDAATTDTYIAFKATYDGTYYYVSIDDVVWESIPSCLSPTDVAVENITSDGADLSWDEEPNASEGYHWYVFEAGDDPEDDDPVVDDTSTDEEITITGLDSETEYEAYVVADCGSTDGMSVLSNPVNFETEPSCFVPENLQISNINEGSADLSWDEEPNASEGYHWYVFEAGDNPEDDDPVADDTSTNEEVSVTGLDPDTEYEAYIEADCGSTDGISSLSNSTSFVTTPTPVIVSTASPVEDETYCYDNDEFQKWLFEAENGEVMTITFQAGTLEEGAWSGTNDDLMIYDGNNDSGAVLFNSDSDGADLTDMSFEATSGYIYITLETDVSVSCADDDEVEIDFDVMITACPAPENLQVSNITSEGADISWDETSSSSPAGGYNWSIFAAGDDPDEDDEIDDGNVSTATVEITDLDPDTEYEIYIIANCDTDGESNRIGPVSFLTECEDITPDYDEDFSEFLSDCWRVAGAGNPTDGPSDFGSSNWSEDDYLNDEDNSTAPHINLFTDNREDWLISPNFDLSGGTYELVYKTGLTDYNNTNAPEGDGMGADDEVQVLITEDNGVTWENLKTYDQSDYPPEIGLTEIIDLSSYSGTIKIAFWATDGEVGDTEDYDFFIDDFEIRTPPTCPEPTGLAVENITPFEADLTWDEEPDASEGYHWYVYEAGDEPGVDAPVADNTTTDEEASIAGLDPDTEYEAYVEADCGTPAGESSLSDAESFTTEIACPAPENLEIENITETGVDLSWDEVSDASEGYHWYVYEAGDEPGVDAPVADDPTTDEEVTITGLNPETEYDVYVEADCGDTNGMSSSTTDTFETIGTPPVNDNLEDAIALTIDDTCTGDNYTNANATTQTDEPAGSCGYSGDGVQTSVWFTFEAPAGGEVIITTDILPGELDDSQIAVFPEPTDTDDLSTLPAEIGCDEDGGSEIVLMSYLELDGLTAGDTYYIQVDGYSGEEGGFCIEVQLPPCEDPTDIAIDNETSDSADISWAENGDATEWEILYGEAGFDPTDEGESLMDDDGTLGETLEDLDPDTEYDVYVRAVCSADNMSDWAGPESFYTELPPCEDPSDIVISNETSDSADISWAENGDATEWEILYGEAGFDPTDEGENISDDDGTLGETIEGLDSDTEYDVYVRALCADNMSDWAGPESFSTELPPCEDPSDIVISNEGPESADISWTENGDATEWEILYGETGFDPSTGGESITDNDGTLGETIEGLDPETEYDIYVRALCADNMSDWVGPETFMTLPLSVESENFQSFTYHPNPVEGRLFMQANMNIDEMTIYNLLGQEVKTKSFNSLEAEVDLSNLSSGAYLMTVTIDGAEKTFRIIKE